MRSLAVLILCLQATGASAATIDMVCTHIDGSGTFHFSIDTDKSQVTVGRYAAIPAKISASEIDFHYFFGQLVNQLDSPEYIVTFDRASGQFSSHTPAGETSYGRRWGTADFVSICK